MLDGQLDPVALARARLLSASGRGRVIRARSGLCQAEAARAIGVGRSTLCRWEIGAKRPTGAAALRWVEMLDLLRESGVPYHDAMRQVA